MAVVSTDTAIEANDHYICFATFWWDSDNFRLGKAVSVTLHKVGDIAHVWSTDLPKAQHVR